MTITKMLYEFKKTMHQQREDFFKKLELKIQYLQCEIYWVFNNKFNQLEERISESEDRLFETNKNKKKHN